MPLKFAIIEAITILITPKWNILINNRQTPKNTTGEIIDAIYWILKAPKPLRICTYRDPHIRVIEYRNTTIDKANGISLILSPSHMLYTQGEIMSIIIPPSRNKQKIR